MQYGFFFDQVGARAAAPVPWPVKLAPTASRTAQVPEGI